MAIMAFALLLAAAGEPGIQVETVPGRGYSAAVEPFDSGTMASVTERIKVAAAERCGKLSVRFGRHYFDSRIDAARNVTVVENMRQNFFCFDPATDPYKPVPADWTASPAETANATAFATRFLDRLDRGDAVGIAMMDPLVELTQADWDGLREAVLLHRTGGGGALTPKFVTWVNNPDWAAYPGAYAFFQVLDDHPGIAATCGGILVQRVRENEYRISQYDVQYIAQAFVDEQGLIEEDIQRLCQR